MTGWAHGRWRAALAASVVAVLAGALLLFDGRDRTPEELCPGANQPIVGVRHGGSTREGQTVEPRTRPPQRSANGRLGSVQFALVPDGGRKMPALIDSNSPSFWADGEMYLFNSVDGFQTFRSSGASLNQLSGIVAVELPEPQRLGKVWLEAVWYDAGAQLLYGWYHFEPSTLECQTAPAIGAAVSRDLGLTWEDRGFVIENANAIDCSYDNGYFSGGSGDFSVVQSLDRSYFYFLFSAYAGPLSEQGVAVARSSFAERGQPGTVAIFYNGAWNEPGVGGHATALFASSTGWKGPYVEAFWGPSVHWNAYLQRYVMLVNHAAGQGFEQEGVYISFSANLERWTAPSKLIDGGGWYPQTIGLDEDGSDSVAGRRSRFYQAGSSCYTLEFTLLTPVPLN